MAPRIDRVTLRLYDTATREVRDFVPLVEGRVGVYVCGLTVQSEPHVGHVRSAVNFDVLQRWLRSKDFEVTFIRNVTDIDDKILTKAAEQGRPWYNLAQSMHAELTRAYALLNVAPPTYEPLATAHVPEMLALIELLIERGHAYAAPDGSGDVYFDVRSWSDYGELSHQGVEDMESAADADPRGKRDPRDFALWKGRKESEPATASWPSPWGPGRPGWHIECSAMAGKYLGSAFDIHGGGLDLRFPHHENEQAQSRAAGQHFANFWMHNAWITTAGEKMSKSLGNSLTIPSVLERFRGIELRYYVVAAHYRSHIEFSFEALEEAATGFRRVEAFLERAGGAVLAGAESLPPAFVVAMDDDLGTPAAVAVLHEAVREGNKALAAGEHPTGSVLAVSAMLEILGLHPHDPAWLGGTTSNEDALTHAVDVLIGAMLEQRTEARATKDWAAADAIRDRIKAAGIEIEDTPDGPKWSI